MGENSKIAWTNHTFNPWIGCEKISAGCANCYAEAYAKRVGDVKWGPGEERRRTADATWRQPRKWNRAAAEAGTRARVFCASLADVFDPAVSPAWREQLFRLIDDTPALDWLLLTKRAEEMQLWAIKDGNRRHNVWLGVTAENQEAWNKRIPILQGTPAMTRFVSCEPLIGPIHPLAADHHGIDWIIVGGESGVKARDFDIRWVPDLMGWSAVNGVAFFMKQLGARPRGHDGRRLFLSARAGDNPDEWPEGMYVREFPFAGGAS